jgi:hypothetical protein
MASSDCTADIKTEIISPKILRVVTFVSMVKNCLVPGISSYLSNPNKLKMRNIVWSGHAMVRCFHGTTNEATKEFNQDGQLHTGRHTVELTVCLQAFNNKRYENIPWSVVGQVLHQRPNLQLKNRGCDTVLPDQGYRRIPGSVTDVCVGQWWNGDCQGKHNAL